MRNVVRFMAGMLPATLFLVVLYLLAEAGYFKYIAMAAGIVVVGLILWVALVTVPDLERLVPRPKHARTQPPHKHDWQLSFVGTPGNDDRWFCTVCHADGGPNLAPIPDMTNVVPMQRRAT